MDKFVSEKNTTAYFVDLIREDLKYTYNVLGVSETSLEGTTQHQLQVKSKYLPVSAGYVVLHLLRNAAEVKDLADERILPFLNLLIEKKIAPALAIKIDSENLAKIAFIESLSGAESRYFYVGGVLTPAKELKHYVETPAGLDLQSLEAALNIEVALSIYAYALSDILIKTADICTSMTLEAIRGETGAFDDRLHSLGRPYAGQITTARNIRRLIEQSQFTTEDARIEFGGDIGPRCQDAISIRAVPQTHGAVRDAHTWLGDVIEQSLANNTVTPQPLITYTLDLIAIALIDLGNISERRSFRLLDSRMSYGLPMNLMGENPGFNHGFPVIQAAATAVVAEMKLKAPKGHGQSRFNPLTNAFVPFGLQSCVRIIEILPLLRKVLAIETYMSAQAMDLAKQKMRHRSFGLGSARAHAAIREHLTTVTGNRFASRDMTIAENIVGYGLIVTAVENAIGKLD